MDIDEDLKSISDLDLSLSLEGLDDDDGDTKNEKKKRPRDPDDASAQEPKKKKKRRLKIKNYSKPEATAGTKELLDGLFSDMDFDNEDDGTPPANRATATPDPVTARPSNDYEMDDDAGSRKTTIASTGSRVTEIKRVVLDGIPLLSQTTRSDYCRCVYSSDKSYRASFNLLDKSVSVPYNFARQRWAVMARCAAPGTEVPRGGRSQVSAEGALSRKDERGEKPPPEIDVETEWFVLIGDPALKFVCSPFFTYHLSMAQVDPDAVLFTLNKTAPVYRLSAVLDKTPLFSGGNERWDEQQIINAMQDTLYAHVLLKSANEHLTEVLCNIDAFPQADSPHDKPIAKKKVPLNSFSERTDRKKKLRELIGKPCKKRFEGLGPVRGNRSEALTGCGNLRGMQHVLFADLEKPKIAFRLLGAGVPIETISPLTGWKDSDAKSIQDRFNNIYDALTYKPGKKVFPATIARDIRLDPKWFARYYEWLCDERHDTERFKSRTSRLQAYRTFVASDLYHDIVKGIRMYRSHITFIFTKARSQKFFESNRFVRCSLDDEEALLCGQIASGGRAKELDEEEREKIIELSLKVLEQFGKKDFIIVTKDDAHRSKVSVSIQYSDTMKLLARFLVQVSNTWVDAAERHTMPQAYRKMAPLVAKSSFMYSGKKHQSDRDEILKVLNDGAAGKMQVQLIDAGEDRAKMQGKVLSGTQKRPVVLVLNNLHAWRLEQIKALADVARRLGPDSRITHVVTLCHANTLSKTVGANVGWDLTDIGVRIEGLALPEVEAPSMFDLPNTPECWVPSGERSEWIFPSAQRAQQLEYNSELLKFSQERPDPAKKDLGSVRDALRMMPSNAPPNTILVLYARNKTQERVRGWIQNSKAALIRETQSAVVFVSYFNLESVTSSLTDVRLTIVADIAYEGANRPTYQHINTVLERTRDEVLVLGNRHTFEKMYRDNGIYTDRHTYHLSRLPYLKELLEKKLFDSATSRLILFKNDE